MQELGLDLAHVRAYFLAEFDQPYLLLKVPPDVAASWAAALSVPLRRCYIADVTLQERVAKTGRSASEIVAAKLPDAGSVMSGDFGEILAALFLASDEHPADVRDPKKWRLKQARSGPAPYSDVVQFVLPIWPDSSADDQLICAEVKTKATAGASTPITSAIADSRKDREGRLAKTIVWLRERALGENLGTLDLSRIERFTNAVDHPPAARYFRAVAVISSDLIDDELDGVEPPAADECTLVIISVPDLKQTYQDVYAAIVAAAETADES